jgi:glycosyltransferase involved in cell wall biosynthesis
MTVQRIAIIGHQAFSILNFRGPLIRHFVANGHQVLALAPDYSDADRAAVRALGATPLDYPLGRTRLSPIGDIATIRHLTSRLRQIRSDVVLSYSIKPVIYGTLAAWLSGVPRRYALIEGAGYTFASNPEPRVRMLRVLVRWLYRLSLSCATRVLFLNRDDLAEFVGLRLVDARKAANIGAIGVDLQDWHSTPTIGHPLTFLFIGRLLHEKGIDQFVEAARRIKSAYPEVRFVAAGELDENPGSIAREQLRSWAAEGTVEWPGHVDVKPLLSQASVFVLPSFYREGVPRTTQEAMAMGRPIITTDVPGCRDTVENGVNGFLIAPRDVDALHRTMMRFVLDRSLIASMGANSRRLAEARLDVRCANNRISAELGL